MEEALLYLIYDTCTATIEINLKSHYHVVKTNQGNLDKIRSMFSKDELKRLKLLFSGDLLSMNKYYIVNDEEENKYKFYYSTLCIQRKFKILKRKLVEYGF